MSEVVVVGAGIAGLSASLALARGGHRVRLLERDRAEPPAGPSRDELLALIAAREPLGSPWTDAAGVTPA